MLMDDETRLWIDQQVADSKYTSNIQLLFKYTKQIACNRPNALITDCAPNFADAFKKEFFTISNPITRHIAHIRLQGDHNNNKMDHMNEVRDREKFMRELKRPNTPILTGYQLFHNYLKPHEGLNEKTPSDKCSIVIEEKNKRKTLIQNTTKGVYA